MLSDHQLLRLQTSPLYYGQFKNKIETAEPENSFFLIQALFFDFKYLRNMNECNTDQEKAMI